MRKLIGMLPLFFTAMFLIACDGDSGPVPEGGTDPLWTWVSGTNTRYQAGEYGTMGLSSASNLPGTRRGSVSWKDSSGILWLFGGEGYDATSTDGYLNDLWKFDGTNWTWVSGANTVNQAGVYGTMSVADPANMPGARDSSVSWIDSSGNFWLFGGYGYDSAGVAGWLNDLWKYDGTNWTWVSGANTVNQPGVYGTLNVADPANVPGSRRNSVSWIDSSGNFWLFGGDGYDAIGALGWLNGLWKFDGTNWIWVSGANTVNQAGVYGTKGIASASNVPEARYGSVSWKDSSGNFWLFGGQGYDSGLVLTLLNDLWKFDGTNWTWMSGANTANQPGVYGTKDVADSANVPGSRRSSVSWIEDNGYLCLFGGYGYDSAWLLGYLNDLWCVEP